MLNQKMFKLGIKIKIVRYFFFPFNGISLVQLEHAVYLSSS
jgi:hypothetical protein